MEFFQLIPEPYDLLLPQLLFVISYVLTLPFAFKKSIKWGIATIFLPFLIIFIFIDNPKQTKIPLIIFAISIITFTSFIAF